MSGLTDVRDLVFFSFFLFFSLRREEKSPEKNARSYTTVFPLINFTSRIFRFIWVLTAAALRHFGFLPGELHCTDSANFALSGLKRRNKAALDQIWTFFGIFTTFYTHFCIFLHGQLWSPEGVIFLTHSDPGHIYMFHVAFHDCFDQNVLNLTTIPFIL